MRKYIRGKEIELKIGMIKNICNPEKVNVFRKVK